MPGKQVRLFLAEGSTSGLMTAEIMNWTGHLISVPRSSMADLFERPEASTTGVYILVGDAPEGIHDLKVYIGEADSVALRLQSHMRPEESGGKDFWDRAIVITSKDANITKAHARYLESRLIEITEESKRATLENRTAPPTQALPEADKSDMEYFIEQLRIALPVLNVNILQRAQFSPSGDLKSDEVRSTATTNGLAVEADGPERSPVFKLRVLKDPDRYAHARAVNSEFVVAKGSYAAKKLKTMLPNYRALRNSLIDKNILVESASDARAYQLAEDYVFSSPSAAAAVMNASSENGRRRWVADDGTSYGQWEELQSQVGSTTSP